MFHLRTAKRNAIFAQALIVLGFIFASAPTFAVTKNEGLELSADDISRDYEARTVILNGNVKIRFDADAIFCNRATINMKSQVIMAEGNVRLESGDTYIEGEKIVYNYKTKLGEIEKGFVQSGQVVFSGEQIEKLSEKKYLAHSARFTSCTNCPALWSFSGSQIEAEMGGYASIKYPILRVMDFPVFILPRIWVPLKSDRQSGVLVPSLENSSRGGTAFTIPYFWAISRSQDLTYSLKSYEKRGLKHLAEYRFVLSPDSSGLFNFGYLNDKNFTDTGRLLPGNDSFDRGFLSYQHYFHLPDNYIHRAQFNTSSDLRYARDFSDEMLGHGDPALENRFSITRNTNENHVSAEIDYYTNMLKANPEANNVDAVHRMPEIRYSYMEHELWQTNLFFKFDFDYTHFARKDYSYDDITKVSSTEKRAEESHDGTFDYDGGLNRLDLIRTGHRYIFQPSLSYPFHLGRFLDIQPSVTFNQTEYRFNVEPDQPLTGGDRYSRNAERNFLQTDISMRTKYSAIYQTNATNPKATKYKHEIEPEIIHSRISHAERPAHIFFGDFENQPYSRRDEALSNEDFYGTSGVQFDYQDRLFDKNIVTFVLNNHIIQKAFSGDSATYNRIVTFRLAQGYDFNEAKRENARPWSSINGLLDMRFAHFETHTTADHYPYAAIAKWSTRLKYIVDTKNYLELTYSKDIDLNESQKRTVNKTETVGTGIGYRSKYLDLIGRTNFSVTSSKLESWEYVSSLKLPGDCWSVKFGHKQNLGADTVFKFSLNFDFGGV